jgi:iron(III) transport system ATP-binding protein
MPSNPVVMADLAVSDLAVGYGAHPLLSGVSFAAPAGKVVALVGRSGCGKTSLLRAVAGLVTPERGSIALGDTILFHSEQHMEAPVGARGFGVPSVTLWPHRTVFENVADGLAPHRLAEADVRSRVEQALAQAGIADLAGSPPAQLSCEQQQRAVAARVLVADPAVLLLDEPLAWLEAGARAEARGWLRHLLAGQSRPVLVATQDPVEAMALADYLVLLNGGTVEQAGAPAELYHEPVTLAAAELMGRNNRFEATVVENDGKRAVVEVLGTRLDGISRTRAAPGEQATAAIRVERTLLGGGPGANRVMMALKAQMCIGPRWELVLAKDALAVRAYTSAPLRHERYHVEFPPQALWIF